MTKARLAVFLALALWCVPLKAQVKATLSAAASNCLTTNVCLSIPIPTNAGSVTFGIPSNASGNTIQFEATNDPLGVAAPSASWVAFNMNPSNSTTPVSSMTSTGAWQANPGAYTAVRMRMSTLAGGTTSVTANTATPSARAGGGSGDLHGAGAPSNPCTSGTLYTDDSNGNVYSCSAATWFLIGGGGSFSGAISKGQYAFGTASNTFSGTANRIDCSAYTSAGDFGAVINACTAALPGSKGIADATNIHGAQTLSTAVTIPAKVRVDFGSNLSVSQSAAITLSNANSAIHCPEDQSAIFTKAGNIDQITLSAAQTAVENCTLAGVKASFTGNGIVTASGAVNALIRHNNISGEANDDISDGSATFSANLITQNILNTWGVHAYQSNGTSQQSTLQNNVIQGDGTSTGAAVLNGGSCILIGNFVKDSNGTILVDMSAAAQPTPVTGNRFVQTSGWTALKTGGNASVTGNIITGGGANGPAALSSGSTEVWSQNYISGTNADALDVNSGNTTVSNNIMAMSVSIALSGHAVLNFNSDNINSRSFGNQLGIGDATSFGNLNYCLQDAPVSTHNLGMLFEGDTCSGTLGGTATVDGFFLNNAANLNTNWSVAVKDFSCVHITVCIKRTDTQNNLTLYTDIQPEDATLDNGTGSTADVWVWNVYTVGFATLPSPAGNGSHGYCTNCTQAKPTASGGAGALAYHEAGQWNGL